MHEDGRRPMDSRGDKIHYNQCTNELSPVSVRKPDTGKWRELQILSEWWRDTDCSVDLWDWKANSRDTAILLTCLPAYLLTPQLGFDLSQSVCLCVCVSAYPCRIRCTQSNQSSLRADRMCVVPTCLLPPPCLPEGWGFSSVVSRDTCYPTKPRNIPPHPTIPPPTPHSRFPIGRINLPCLETTCLPNTQQYTSSIHI